MVDIQENIPRDVNGLQEWAQNNGVQRVDGFQLGSEDGLDWYAGTTQPLAQGSPILSIPGPMILSTAATRRELNVDAAVDQLARLGAGNDVPEFYLFCKVLAEYQNGDQSPWFPWLNSLPRLYYNAISMTDFCYECLPPLVFSLARKEKVKLDNFVSALQKVDVISQEIINDPEITKWAYNVVTTRCFGPDDNKQIIPMGDMFNHGTETEIDFNFDEEGNCIVYAAKDVPANSPLRMSYGDPTNPSVLFAKYGFLDESSPATFCKIMTIQPTPELLNLGLDFSKMLFYKDSGEISEEVWDVMLYSQVLAQERDVQQQFYQAHMNGDAETKNAIHQHYFMQTSAALQKHVDTFLKQLDDLSAKGVGKDPQEHPRLPLILRHNDFVKTTFMTVKARLDSMAVGQPA